MKLFGKTKSADADEEPLVADEGIEPADIEGGQVVDTDAAADVPDDFSTPERRASSGRFWCKRNCNRADTRARCA